MLTTVMVSVSGSPCLVSRMSLRVKSESDGYGPIVSFGDTTQVPVEVTGVGRRSSGRRRGGRVVPSGWLGCRRCTRSSTPRRRRREGRVPRVGSVLCRSWSVTYVNSEVDGSRSFAAVRSKSTARARVRRASAGKSQPFHSGPRRLACRSAWHATAGASAESRSAAVGEHLRCWARHSGCRGRCSARGSAQAAASAQPTRPRERPILRPATLSASLESLEVSREGTHNTPNPNSEGPMVRVGRYVGGSCFCGLVACCVARASRRLRRRRRPIRSPATPTRSTAARTSIAAAAASATASTPRAIAAAISRPATGCTAAATRRSSRPSRPA